MNRWMRFSIPIGRITGVEVRVHWSLLVCAIPILWLFRHDLRLGLLINLGLWGSVLLHELGHCWGARQVGGGAKEILLWPLGGLAMVHAPMHPWPQFFSTLTGPLVNVIIAGVAAPIFLLLGGHGEALLPWASSASQTTLGLSFLEWLVTINLIMVVFNVIPAYPLDGGRMFQAALWPKFGFHKAMTWAVYASFGCAAIMLGFAVVTQSVILGLIAIWVFQGAALEKRRLRYGLYADLADSPWGGGGEFSVHEPEPSAFAKWKERRAQRRDEDERRRKRELRERLDEVLATVSEVGLDGLSKDERIFLDQASQELRKEQSGKSSL